MELAAVQLTVLRLVEAVLVQPRVKQRVRALAVKAAPEAVLETVVVLALAVLVHATLLVLIVVIMTVIVLALEVAKDVPVLVQLLVLIAVTMTVILPVQDVPVLALEAVVDVQILALEVVVDVPAVVQEIALALVKVSALVARQNVQDVMQGAKIHVKQRVQLLVREIAVTSVTVLLRLYLLKPEG